MLSDLLLRQSFSSAKKKSKPCANAEESITHCTIYPLWRDQDALWHDLGPSMSSGAATMPSHLHQPSIKVSSISTTPLAHPSDKNENALSRESAPTTSSSHSNMSPHANLPAELWSMTLQYLRERKSQEDLTYVWINVRHVWKLLRGEIDEIFMEEDMEKTGLYADCDGYNQRIVLSNTIFNLMRTTREEPFSRMTSSSAIQVNRLFEDYIGS